MSETKKINSGFSDADLTNRIYSFCEAYSGISFYPYQKQFAKRLIQSILKNDGEEITALFSRQSGKSETVATVAGGLMVILPVLANMPMFLEDVRLKPFVNGLWIGIFAPSQRQAQITFDRIKTRMTTKRAREVLTDPDIAITFTTANGQTIKLSNGSFVTAISASDNSNIEGESFKLIICEEAQDISDYKITKSIHPMGAYYNSSIIKIGTATTKKGNFYHTIERNKERAKTETTHIKNHFEFDCKVVSRYNSNYAKTIEKEKIRIGEHSDEFRMSYNLEWVFETGMFIDLVDFTENNINRELGFVESDLVNSHVVGIDIGGKGDSTVITVLEVDWDTPAILEEQYDAETNLTETYVAYNTKVKALKELIGISNYETQYEMIMDYLPNFNISKIYVDATREKSIADRLNANLPYEVVPFIFSRLSKSDMYKYLEGEITTGRVQIPGNDEARRTMEYHKFEQQLGDLEKTYTNGYMVVKHPTAKNAHDDYPDSFALAVYASSDRSTVTQIEQATNRLFRDGAKDTIHKLNGYTARRR